MKTNKKAESLVGKTLGYWTIISATKDRMDYCDCVCVCGTKKSVHAYSLSSGKSKSCGCASAKMSFETRAKRNGGLL